MKLLTILGFALLTSSMTLGQTASPNASSSSDSSNITNELKSLRDAITEQQKQIAQQQQEIEKLRQQVAANGGTAQAHAVNASLSTTNMPDPAVHSASDSPQEADKPKESPLSFRIGGADFTPGGYVDFENIFRTTNTTNNTGTNFGTIPFSNTVQGHLTEFRTTGQYSRFNLKSHGVWGNNDITGFIEIDFNGNDATNVFVQTNPHTNRLRHYYLDLKRGKWEFLGGQTWGWLMANRTGVSTDHLAVYNEDANHGVGNNFTRAGQFRAIYHFNDHVAWGVGIENPQQFVNAGEVNFPFDFNAQLGNQFDTTNNTSGVPNVGPDVLSKIAFDNNFAGGRHFHIEAGGLLTTTKITILPVVAPTVIAEFKSHSRTGGAVEGAILIDLAKGSNGTFFRLVSSGVWGNGVGRYLNGLGPNAVVVPIQTGTSPATFDADVSLVHSGNALVGFEGQVHPKLLLAGYYGGAYFQRNAFLDPTNPVPGRIIGFGGINSSNFANRSVQEVSLDLIYTFWKHPQYGALQWVNQASYLTRSPWFVPAGAPKNAHLAMGYMSLKYVLP